MLEIKGLVKTYGTVRALDSVSLEVCVGQIYGLLGPNGAGKTTTISIICGLLRPDAGQVMIDGRDFWSDPSWAKATMGVVPQELAIYEDLSGMENLEFWGRLAGLSAKQARSSASSLLEKLGLSDRANDLVRTYSGGMKKRVNLACALLHKPRLLLLDEPTAGLDPQARLVILRSVQELRDKGTAILYTTHYLEEAEAICDTIGILDHGRLLVEGTVRQLQERLGGDRLFVVEADLRDAKLDQWPGFTERFRLLQWSDRQLIVAARGDCDPCECLKELLALPIPVENVTFKRPSLSDLFLQLTGRELRD